MESEQDSAVDELADGVDIDTEQASLGPAQRLREAREEQRLELKHIAAETRIPIRHLETIEAGDFSELPSRTYAIGFARTYARTLGLDEAEIADAVRDELADGAGYYSVAAGGMEPGDPAKLPSRGLAWFGGFAALILAVGLIAFFSSRFGAGDALPSLVSDDDAETVETAAASSDAATPQDAPASPDGEVVFTALEDGVWVRFYEDGGERLFEAQMSNGDSFALPAEAVEPRINTGRPDAFAITIGGRSVPKLSEEPVTMGDTPISAEALLARPAPGSEETGEG